MLNRRHLAGLLAGTAAFPAAAWDTAVLPFYNSTGPELFLHGLDPETGTLTPHGSVILPANVQYAWPHPSKRFLYVASSDGMPGGSSGPGAPGKKHSITTFRVDSASGALEPHGIPMRLTARPIHLSINHEGSFVLVTYNDPSHVTVHRLRADGALGEAVPQPTGLDFGTYAHQGRATPSNRTVILVTRGNDATAGKREDPGAIKIFNFRAGRLTNLASIAPGGGYGFGPRHLDFHPTLPLVYVSLERQNALYVYGLTPTGNLTSDPLFRRNTLRQLNWKATHPGQGAGPIHVHPNGRFVYLANRGSGTIDFKDQKVWNGGENSVAVFAIDGKTGAPTHIQSIDAHGFEPRTFTMDPSGKILIAANTTPLMVREGDATRKVSAGLSFYRIGTDGRLTFLRKQDVDTARGTQFWCGLLTMP